MSENEVSVSVIMPAHNAAGYLPKAIESVRRQRVRWELWVIDDASTDGTARLLENYREDGRIHVVRNEKNLGAAESRNIGIRNAAGKYVAFLDADDWWADGKLAAQLSLLKKTGAVLCCTGRELVREDGTGMGKVIGVPRRITYPMLLKTNYIPCSSVVMRTEAAREFYMGHESLHEDYILWLNVLKRHGAACGIDRPLLKSRMSRGGKSRNKWKSARMQWGVYRLMGFGRLRSAWYMLHYAAHGLMKYHLRKG